MTEIRPVFGYMPGNVIDVIPKSGDAPVMRIRKPKHTVGEDTYAFRDGLDLKVRDGPGSGQSSVVEDQGDAEREGMCHLFSVEIGVSGARIL